MITTYRNIPSAPHSLSRPREQSQNFPFARQTFSYSCVLLKNVRIMRVWTVDRGRAKDIDVGGRRNPKSTPKSLICS